MRSNIRGSRAVHILQGQGLIKAESRSHFIFTLMHTSAKCPATDCFIEALLYKFSYNYYTLEGRESKVEARGGLPDFVTSAQDLVFIGFKI